MASLMRVTVEEAASRLDKSVATVRRMLNRGKLAGEKIGRDWQVDESALPPLGSATGAARPAAFSDQELARAIEHISSVDLSELWVPDIVRWGDALSAHGELVQRVRRRLAADLPGHATEVRVPKTALASRVGTMIDLVDRIIYQAAAGRLAAAVDAATSPRVFSSRLSPVPRYFLLHSVGRYVEWRKAYMAQLKSRGGMLVSTDLSSYFDMIDQPTLLKELEELTGEVHAVQLIRKQLKAWTVLLHRGIPQGPNASRLLGNAYLLPVDELMFERGYDYWRYMDDVAIIVADQAEAARAVADFERACHRRGLILSSAKTIVRSEQEAEADAEGDQRDHIEYLIAINSGRARSALLKVFNHALPRRHGPIDVGDVKFSLWRLARRLDRGPLSRLLERLQDLGPVASVSAAYLRHFLSNQKTEQAISDFLHDPERNTSDYLESWLFAAMLEYPTRPPERWISRARAVALDKNCPGHHRALAANVLALGMKASDLAEIKRIVLDEHDPEIVRGALVALRRVSKLDRLTISAAEARIADLSTTIRYLQPRRTLPSLVYRGRTVPIRG
jgi:excisionase family DNA binding protein